MFFKAANNLSTIHFKIIGDMNIDNVQILVVGEYKALSECTAVESDGFPSISEIDTEVARLQSESDATAYQRQRALEYPTHSELIVALWEREVEGRPEAADALEILRQAVKAQYPKPV